MHGLTAEGRTRTCEQVGRPHLRDGRVPDERGRLRVFAPESSDQTGQIWRLTRLAVVRDRFDSLESIDLLLPVADKESACKHVRDDLWIVTKCLDDPLDNLHC